MVVVGGVGCSDSSGERQYWLFVMGNCGGY